MRSRPEQARQDGPRPTPTQERRLPPQHSARARLRWLRGLVLRPIRLRWQRGPRLVWVERRRTGDPELALLRADLQAALLSIDGATELLDELLQVGERLGEAGWAGLATLPAATRTRARLQAQLLADDCGSAALAELARRLQALERPGRAGSPLPGAAAAAVEVSELGEDDYTQAEQAWACSQPAPPAPDLKA